MATRKKISGKRAKRGFHHQVTVKIGFYMSHTISSQLPDKDS
jgi:hypothetical protein